MPVYVQSFYLHFSLMYALSISYENIFKSFEDASINVILTLSLDTTLEYVIDDGSYVVLPSVTNLAFLVNFPSILISDIMCTLMFSYPGLIFHFLFSSVVEWFHPQMIKINYWLSQLPVKGTQFSIHVL